jgi:hypothetical protein
LGKAEAGISYSDRLAMIGKSRSFDVGEREKHGKGDP